MTTPANRSDSTQPTSAHQPGSDAASPQRESLLLSSTSNGIATLTLNRPQRMNALTVLLLLELAQELERLEADDTVRIIVLTGAQGNFSTGADLKDTAPGPNGEIRLDVLHRCFTLLTESRKPLIAAVEGNAYGAGFSLALACDYVIAGATARFCAPFTGIGLIPDTGLAYTLPLRIGMGRAKRMMYEGLVVESTQAEQWGLADVLASDQSALECAYDLGKKLLIRAPLALAALRELLAHQWTDPQAFLREERRLQRQLQESEDVLEGRRAFAERRPPRFSGR